MLPDPRRQGIKPERGEIVAKMRDRSSIVNGGLLCPIQPLRLSGKLFSDSADDWHVGIGQDEEEDETADESAERYADTRWPVRSEVLLKILTKVHCKCRHRQQSLS
jgi:hypothetical protein